MDKIVFGGSTGALIIMSTVVIFALWVSVRAHCAMIKIIAHDACAHGIGVVALLMVLAAALFIAGSIALLCITIKLSLLAFAVNLCAFGLSVIAINERHSVTYAKGYAWLGSAFFVVGLLMLVM